MDNITKISRNDLLQSMAQGATVLTVNNRLKNTLQQEYGSLQTTKSWETPRVFTLTEWVYSVIETSCFQNIIPSSYLPNKIMTPFAQQLLFRKTIKKVEQSPLLSESEIAKHACEAWQRIRLYEVDGFDTESDFFISQEWRQFKIWLAQYQDFCQKNKSSDDTDLLHILVTHLPQLQSLLPKTTHIAGFDQSNPLLDKLFAGLNVSRLYDQQPHKSVHKTACTSLNEEIHAAALWAQNIYAQDSTSKIGILVPQLEQHQQQIKHIFKTTLYPNQAGLNTDNYSPIHNVSLGSPLYSHAMVATALTWLEALTEPEYFDYQVFSALLRSPYWSQTPDDFAERMAFDLVFREQIAPKTNLAQCTAVLKGHFKQELPPWAQAIINIQEQPLATSDSLRNWATQFSNILSSLGFANFPRSSLNEQLLLGLKNSLASLSDYAFIEGKVSAARGCQLLKQVTQRQTFQFRSQDDAPIQIMGLLESAGQAFDYVWLMQADNQNLPAPASPNPILPLELQIAYHMPRCNSAHELAYAKILLQRIQDASQEMMISYANLDENGVARLESGLIKTYPSSEITQITDKANYKPVALETLSDDIGIPLVTPYHLRGATAFFKAQAICPLMAYAQFRLGAIALPEPQSSLNPLTRGIVVHQVLEKTMPAKTVHTAQIAAIVQQHFKHLSPKVIALEILRIQHLIEDWHTEIENQRLPFDESMSEVDIKAELHGLSFSLRIDRIDHTEAGWLLIDYKTGQSITTQGWFDERLTEPQMPLYATTLTKEVSGIAFGKVIAGKPSLPHKSCTALFDKKSRNKPLDDEEWQGLQTQWEDKLHMLAKEISQGHALLHLEPAVANSPAVGFCRIYDYV